MLLMFGKETVDTKGLPRIAVVNSHGYSDGVTVYVLLESRTRAAIEKWAARLGAPVIESAGTSADDRQISAEAESDGYRLHVYTYVPAAPADSDPAEFPWRVYAQPQDGARWIVNAFRTRERAQRFTERHPEQYGPLTIEDATAPGAETAAATPQQETTHHAVMRHGSGGPECCTPRVWEPMTRDARAVTCPDCLATLTAQNGGAS